MILIFLILFGPEQAWTSSENFSIPLDALDERGREKVEDLLKGHTLERSPSQEHPIVNRELHQFLLDRPDVGAGISRALGIGDYTVTREGKDVFHASDPAGIEGNLEILYRDEARRVYFAEGYAEGALLTVRGKTLVAQQSQYWTTDQGQEWVRSDLTIYAKIKNPLLALFLKIFAPLLNDLVDSKLSKAQGVVQQVNEAMVQDPQETYRRIAESDQLPVEDLQTLRKLMNLPDRSTSRGEPS
ncbi:MAG: hypothetical protein ACE5I0_10730 [Candidatus Binatia bacterium]